MKFEVVEQPGWDALADDHADVDASRTAGEDDAGASDPLDGLRAETARLVSDIQADARQISECAAQMTDLAGLAAAATVRPRGRTATRPPVTFRAGRFGGSRRSHDTETTSLGPAADTGPMD
jgi:hypothetical protein